MGRQNEGLPSGTARVTVVIATYNRPEALKFTLRSLLDQTFEDWTAIVVGDCCGPETGRVVSEVNDSRILYVNLPVRCGEQALPNSVGMTLARTDYVAFLNHDDLWLPDHLAHGLASIQSSDAGAFLGAAVFVKSLAREDAVVLIEQTLPGRTFRTAFRRPYYVMEPISTWIVHRRVIRRIGPMTPAADLYRTPLEDWALRFWRGNVRLSQSDLVTVVKDNSLAEKQRSVPTYSVLRPGLAAMYEEIRALGAEGFRSQLPARLAQARSAGAKPRDFRSFHDEPVPGTFRQHLTAAAAKQFKDTGVDAFAEACRAQGLERGRILRRALLRRVGETLGAPPDLNVLVDAARQQIEAGDTA